MRFGNVEGIRKVVDIYSVWGEFGVSQSVRAQAFNSQVCDERDMKVGPFFYFLCTFHKIYEVGPLQKKWAVSNKHIRFRSRKPVGPSFQSGFVPLSPNTIPFLAMGCVYGGRRDDMCSSLEAPPRPKNFAFIFNKSQLSVASKRTTRLDGTSL